MGPNLDHTRAAVISLYDAMAGAFPPVTLPDLTGLEPKTAAETLRQAWAVAEDWDGTMIDLMTDHGLAVFSMPRDGIHSTHSFWHRDRPMILAADTVHPDWIDHDLCASILALFQSKKGRRKRKSNQRSDFATAFLPPEPPAPPWPDEPDEDPDHELYGVALEVPALTVEQMMALARSLREEQIRRFRERPPPIVTNASSTFWRKVFQDLGSEERDLLCRQTGLDAATIDSLVFGALSASRSTSTLPTARKSR